MRAVVRPGQATAPTIALSDRFHHAWCRITSQVMRLSGALMANARIRGAAPAGAGARVRAGSYLALSRRGRCYGSTPTAPTPRPSALGLGPRPSVSALGVEPGDRDVTPSGSAIWALRRGQPSSYARGGGRRTQATRIRMTAACDDHNAPTWTPSDAGATTAGVR